MREEYRIKNKTFKTLSALEELGEDPRGGIEWIIEGLKKLKIMTKEESEKYTDSKLPTIASKISQLGVGVGISPQFMQKETLKLLNAIEKFIKAIQKRGF